MKNARMLELGCWSATTGPQQKW